MAAAIYIVGTPIGNLEDITLRALRVLREVDMILCEDTRVTGVLLRQYGISTRTMSYHSHTPPARMAQIMKLLEEGSSLALVSDAGTPAISDPGVHLVRAVRERFADSVPVMAIPGPSAIIAALSISGITAKEFVFLGFLPHKKGRATLVREIVDSPRTCVVYESSHRIVKFFDECIREGMGEDRRVAVARELTKVHEECRVAGVRDIREYFMRHTDRVRGEFTVIIEGARYARVQSAGGGV